MGSIHTVGHYSALKGNEVLIHATTLTNLGNIRRLTPRATYHMIPFIENVQNSKTIDTAGLWLPRVGGVEGGE